MTDRDAILDGLRNALAKQGIKNPTTANVLTAIVSDESLTELWYRFYGETAPAHLNGARISRLLNDLTKWLNPKKNDHQPLLKERRKINAKKGYIRRKKQKHWLDREFQTMFYNACNPREFGNG